MRITEKQLRKAEQTIRIWKACTKSAKLERDEYVSSVTYDADGKFKVIIKKYKVIITHTKVNQVQDEVPF